MLLLELESTAHAKAGYYEHLKCTIKGDSSRKRSKLGKGVLPLAEQVDSLLDLATDPDVLGRAWTGWNPFA